ncbi:MAG: bacteriophage abortive infection AbiH family protein [Oscillospiraceae bacterium]|nr:bacteriophage abortive infection AbiH family protein [Oscillospiraceae bacterium]
MLGPSKNILLVIGNGFDLQCKLKSGYKDFFAWLRQDNKWHNSFWGVHFLNNLPEGQDWTDIEQSLQETLTSKVNRNQSLLNSWVNTAADFYDRHGGYVIKQVDSEAVYIENHMRESRIEGGTPTNYDSYWFLDQLIAFERQFSEYLQAAMENNANYLSNAVKLMDLLMKDVVDSKKVNVINFNYTNPFRSDHASPESNKLNDLVKDVTNVHGTYVDDNIIFGVDTTFKPASPDMDIFKKTHRKLSQKNLHPGALPPDVSKIKFYGHSLGEADYSYFQSIFDCYDLYGGNLTYSESRNEQVELQFYFSVYDEKRKTEIVRSTTDSVYKLIATYGDSLDNKDKGKNLLHKLLLEGRVQISFLPDLEG